MEDEENTCYMEQDEGVTNTNRCKVPPMKLEGGGGGGGGQEEEDLSAPLGRLYTSSVPVPGRY